ncbi:uncharacterized protein RHO25_002280 [Cercospora beticola]|uniref:Uncharacterized protein n=1 Tax=Cercospora beticola TaxID=122368 RepID=A0ABZ0NDQ3_CERBT|nr:hypothetical protein RHO25_002280 [Cercospora beticola]
MMAETPSPLSESRKRRRSISEDARDEEEAKQKFRIAEHIAGNTLTHRYSDRALDMPLAFIDFEDEQDRNHLKLDALNR